MKEIKLNLYCIRVPRFWIYMTHVFLPLCNYIIKNNTGDTHFILQFPRKCIFHSFFTEVFTNITIIINKNIQAYNNIDVWDPIRPIHYKDLLLTISYLKKISSQKFKPKVSDILFIVRGDSNIMYDYYKNDNIRKGKKTKWGNSRRSFPALPHIANKFIKNTNYNIVIFNDNIQSILEQISYFTHTKNIICLHGGAQVHSIWTNENTNIIEVISDKKVKSPSLSEGIALHIISKAFKFKLYRIIYEHYRRVYALSDFTYFYVTFNHFIHQLSINNEIPHTTFYNWSHSISSIKKKYGYLDSIELHSKWSVYNNSKRGIYYINNNNGMQLWVHPQIIRFIPDIEFSIFEIKKLNKKQQKIYNNENRLRNNKWLYCGICSCLYIKKKGDYGVVCDKHLKSKIHLKNKNSDNSGREILRYLTNSFDMQNI